MLWASEGRSEATRERAAAFRDVGTVRELVAESELVISLCPPAIAEDVAGEVAAEGFDGIYVEGNAISPERVKRIAGYLRCVDGAVISARGRESVPVGRIAGRRRGRGAFPGRAR